MINTTLYWYLLVPLLLSTISIFVLRKYVPGVTWLQSIGAGIIGLLISSLIVTGFFYVGKGSKTGDIQVINGEVTGKTREHGHYLRSYECRCRSSTSCSGSGKNRSCSTTRKCDTCYEDRYTVTWDCQSNIGTIPWTNTANFSSNNP